MIQNIDDVYGDVRYKTKTGEKGEKVKRANIFSNVFAKENILLYIIVFMISTIGIGQDVSPFSLAIVTACIAAEIPILGIAVMGLIGNSIAFGVTGALNYMVMLLVLIATFFVFKPVYNEESRNEKIKISFNLFISIFLVWIFKLLIAGFSVYGLFVTITMTIVTVMFYKIFVNSLSVIQDFRTSKAFSIEEVLGASLLLAIAVSAFGDIAIYGFSIRNILSILIVMALGWKNGILIGTTSGVTIGVTLGIIAQTEPMMIAAYAISGMVAGILNRFGRIGVIIGFILGNGVLAYISNGATHEFIMFKEILIAGLGLLAMPKNLQINIEEFIGKNNFLPVFPSGALNKSKETVTKLTTVSKAIQNIADTYSEKDQVKDENEDIFIAELLNQLDNIQDNMLYEDLSKTENGLAGEIFKILMDKQNVTRKDLLKAFAKQNNYIVGFDDKEVSQYLEKNIEEILKAINVAYRISKSNFVMQKKIEENRKNIGTQLGEVSKAISNIAEDMSEDIKEQNKFENEKKEISILINQMGIKVEDVSVKKQSNGRFAISIYTDDELDINQKEKIMKILSNVLKEDIELNEYKLKENMISYLSADKYLLNMGIAKTPKKGNRVSGDTTLKVRLEDGKYLVALSDGMGSGTEANKSSKLALSMLQNLLSSGFDRDTSIELINSTILNTTEEIYATLDIAIVDLYKGNIEFVKNGACPTYIKNKKKVQLIKSLALPTGIVENVNLTVYDKDIENNEIMVMCSDGILDSNVEYKNKELWVKYILEDMETDNAQKIADIILNESIDNNYGIAKDDMSVVVCKFMKK